MQEPVDFTQEQQENIEQVKGERHQLQHLVQEMAQQIQELNNQYALSMTNELAALRQLVPYLNLENKTLKDALENQE